MQKIRQFLLSLSLLITALTPVQQVYATSATEEGFEYAGDSVESIVDYLPKFFGSGGFSNLEPALRDYISELFMLNLGDPGEWKNTGLDVNDGDQISIELKDANILIEPISYKILYVKDCITYPNGLLIDKYKVSNLDGKASFEENLDKILRGEMTPPKPDIEVNAGDAVKVKLLTATEYFGDSSDGDTSGNSAKENASENAAENASENAAINNTGGGFNRPKIDKSKYLAREDSLIKYLFNIYQNTNNAAKGYYSTPNSLGDDKNAVRLLSNAEKLKYAINKAVNSTNLTTLGVEDSSGGLSDFSEDNISTKYEKALSVVTNDDVFSGDINIGTKDFSKYYSYAFFGENNMYYLSNDVLTYYSNLYGLYDLGYTLFGTGCFPINSTGLAYMGVLDASGFMKDLLNNSKICSHIDYSESDSPCKFKDGRGIYINAGGGEIKYIDEPFIKNSTVETKFGYYFANSSGKLDIGSLGCKSTSCSDNSFGDVPTTGYVFSGNYYLGVEIGKGPEGALEKSVVYTISDGPPDSNVTGEQFKPGEKMTANNTGTLWLRSNLKNTNSTLPLRVSNYSGINFARTMQEWVIDPIISSLNNAAENRFNNFVNSDKTVGIIHTLMTLYILIYALYYVAGAATITYKEIVSILIKLAVVSTLISKGSWQFFNDNLFVVFKQGIKDLILMITSNESDNMFGFIDKVITRFITPETIKVMFAYLLQIFNGLFMIGVLLGIGIYTYFKTILDLLLKYIQAYLILNILIMLAPIFITMMLFDKTRSMFDKWVSFMVSTLLSPVVTMLVVLMVDDIIKIHFYSIMDVLEWQNIFNLTFNMDFNKFGLWLGFGQISWTIFDIHYFAPAQSSGFGPFASIFIFLIATHIVRGANEFGDTIVSTIVGTTFVGKGGKRKNTSMGDGSGSGSSSPYQKAFKQYMRPVKAGMSGARELGGMAGRQVKELFNEERRKSGKTTESGKKTGQSSAQGGGQSQQGMGEKIRESLRKNVKEPVDSYTTTSGSKGGRLVGEKFGQAKGKLKDLKSGGNKSGEE